MTTLCTSDVIKFAAFRLPIVFAAIEVSALNTLQAVNFYSFYLYRTALSKTLAATQTNLGGLDRFLAGAMAGNYSPCHAKFHGDFVQQ